LQWSKQEARSGGGGGWPWEAVRWRSVAGVGKGNGGAGDSGEIGLVQVDQEMREGEANSVVQLV
jgi:hypothetical protein